MIESLSLITGSASSHPATALLSTAGYDVNLAPSLAAIDQAKHAHAIILLLPFHSLANWCREYSASCQLPLLWWCEENMKPQIPLKEIQIDGILFASMSAIELHWAIQTAVIQHSLRFQLLREREHLQLRLEERRWIEQAKGILCELKKISEDQAYQFLRQQAMNERKKMADVAKSIVNVYRLIHG